MTYTTLNDLYLSESSGLHSRRLDLLLLAPNCDGTDVGEAWRAYKWVEALASHANVTLLTMQRQGRTSVAFQLPNVEVVTMPEPSFVNERLNAMLKISYVKYFSFVRTWLQDALAQGRQFDVGHQITPAALRYPTPFLGFGIPYILGPMAGSLKKPKGFIRECNGAPWYTKLRDLDTVRLRYDPLLRRSFREAAMVIGVASYVGDLLSCINADNFVIHGELGIDDLAPLPIQKSIAIGRLKLLHVGRGVRTKGLRDIVRAMAALKDLKGITLDSAGAGAEIEICRKEAKLLGVSDRITFHGHLSREEIEQLYAASDLFVFPSFREPSGRVISEALRWGLPILTTKVGGPGAIVDSTCGFKVAADNPDQLSTDLSNSLREIYQHVFWLIPMRIGARNKVGKDGLWKNKAQLMLNAYDAVLQKQLSKGAA